MASKNAIPMYNYLLQCTIIFPNRPSGTCNACSLSRPAEPWYNPFHLSIIVTSDLIIPTDQVKNLAWPGMADRITDEKEPTCDSNPINTGLDRIGNSQSNRPTKNNPIPPPRWPQKEHVFANNWLKPRSNALRKRPVGKILHRCIHTKMHDYSYPWVNITVLHFLITQNHFTKHSHQQIKLRRNNRLLLSPWEIFGNDGNIDDDIVI